MCSEKKLRISNITDMNYLKIIKNELISLMTEKTTRIWYMHQRFHLPTKYLAVQFPLFDSTRNQNQHYVKRLKGYIRITDFLLQVR